MLRIYIYMLYVLFKKHPPMIGVGGERFRDVT